MDAAEKNNLKLAIFIGLFALTACLGAFIARFPMKELAAIDLGRIPLSFEGWEGRDEALDEGETSIARESPFLKRTYRRGAETIWLFAVSAAKNRHSVHHPKYCYRGTGWSVVATGKGLGRHHLATEVVLKKIFAGEKYLNLERYWFTDGRHIEPSYFFQLYTAFRLRLLVRQLPNWTLFRVAVEDYTGERRQQEILQTFADDLMKTVQQQFPPEAPYLFAA